MKHDHCTCTVEVSPDEADAGTDITLKVQVTHPRKDGLRGSRVSIRNHEDAELAQAELKKSDGEASGEAYESDDIVLAAPRAAGNHVYRAVVLAADKDGVSHEQASTEIRFVVKPHATELNVWDVPSAIVAGERFKFTVGIRCSAGCNLAGRGICVVDREGSQVAAVNLRDDVWPETDALYFAEVEGEAPAAAGNYQWEVRSTELISDLPHDADAFAVVLKVVNRPDCEIKVEAFDRENQVPIKGARVVMHPYRALTDENGVASVRVTKGQYDILVSASKFLPVTTTVEVTADMITRAELDVEPPLESTDEA
jgi:hypothetical protein